MMHNISKQSEKVKRKKKTFPVSQNHSVITTIEEINERYAVVPIGGKVAVADLKDNKFNLMSFDSAANWFANTVIVYSDGTPWPAFKVWKTSANRRQFERVEFIPGDTAPQGVLNLWSGWGVEAQPYSWPLIQEHLREVVCSGNQVHYDYLLNWIAHMVQFPRKKPDVAVVLKGKKGTGKDTVGVLLERIVGRSHYAHFTRPDDFTNNFNASLEKALFAHVEEAFFSGDRSKIGALQNLITGKSIPITRKGYDTVECDSFIRVLMTTNEDWAIPATGDERRYFALEVSDSRKGDLPYFSRLHAAIEGDEAHGFMYAMMKRDISGFNPRSVPVTRELSQQKLQNLDAFGKWMYDLLFTGALPRHEKQDGLGGARWAVVREEWDDCLSVPKSLLRDCFEEHRRKSCRAENVLSDKAFGDKMAKLGANSVKLPATVEIPGKAETHRPWAYKLPKLDEARKNFAVQLGLASDEIEWPVYVEETDNNNPTHKGTPK